MFYSDSFETTDTPLRTNTYTQLHLHALAKPTTGASTRAWSDFLCKHKRGTSRCCFTYFCFRIVFFLFSFFAYMRAYSMTQVFSYEKETEKNDEDKNRGTTKRSLPESLTLM